MNLIDLIDLIKETSLSHIYIQSFQVGEDFEIATSKSSEIYPVVWLELPIYGTTYISNKKTFSFALDVLANSNEDDVNENVEVISAMEVIADQIMQKLKEHKQVATINVLSSMSLREFSDDYLAGVRLEVEATVSRNCDVDGYFKIIN